MVDRTCIKCGRVFEKPFQYRRHLERKTPCEPILDVDPDVAQNQCKFCGRAFATKQSLSRHMRQRCKIANSEEGMEKLMEHTLQRQMAEMNARTSAQLAEQTAQIAKLTALLEGCGLVLAAPAGSTQHATTIMNGPVTQTQQTIQQQIHIEKVEIRPWDDKRAITVDIREVLAAFAENSRLQEFARLPGDKLTDHDVAPPYVAELFTDLVRRTHENPATRNIYLNPKRADQVLVHLKSGRWEVRTVASATQALLDGVASSIHEITGSLEKLRQLPMEAQNALAMAGLLYDEEPEAYVERTKAPLVAHLTNLAPERSALAGTEKK